jgi:hypothetical protein
MIFRYDGSGLDSGISPVVDVTPPHPVRVAAVNNSADQAACRKDELGLTRRLLGFKTTPRNRHGSEPTVCMSCDRRKTSEASVHPPGCSAEINQTKASQHGLAQAKSLLFA